MGEGANVRVNGVQKKVINAYSKVNGVWKTGELIYSKVNGVWKEAWKDAFPMPSFISYPAQITRGQSITWTTENVTGAAYEYQIAYNGVFGTSQFTNTPTGTFTVTTDTTKTSIQMQVRAVDPTTHGSQSSWKTGAVVSLGAQTLATPTGLTYPSSIARGDRITISWTAVDTATTYELHAYYTDGASGGNVTDTIVYSSKVSGAGTTSTTYNVTTTTKWYNLKFYLKAKKTGYLDSALENGSVITLKGQKLGTVPSLSVPTIQEEVTSTISWGSVTDATQYMLEVAYDKSTNYSRVYWGPNRSVNFKPATGHTYVQFRVHATAPYYTDGDDRSTSAAKISPPPLKSTTWKTTATHQWRPQFGGQWDGDAPGSLMMQGEWTDSSGTWGNYKSLAFFDYSDIREKLKGRTVKTTKVYLYRISTPHGYHTGQPAEIYTHNYSSHPSGEPSMSYADGPSGSFGLGQGAWITVDNIVAERIRDGHATGFGLYSPTGKYYSKFSTNVQLYVEYQ